MDKSLILNEIKEYKNFKTDAEFAEFLGIAPQNLSKWKKRNTFDIELVYTKCPEISPDWLLTGKGEMLKTDQNINFINRDRKTKDAIIDNQEVPLFNFEATAGLVELFNQSKQTNLLNTIKIPNIPACDGAISITGDSMYPLLKSGDIIMYKEVSKDISNIFFGEMYLLGILIDDVDEMVTVKYVHKSDQGKNFIKLVSQNQYHQPKDVELSRITAMAMVKVSIRKNTMF